MTWMLGPVLVVLVVTLPAAGQGKDPFRPPPGAPTVGAGGGGTGAPAGEPAGGGRQAESPSDGLPRTGLDYSVPLLAAMGLLAAGASMRMASAASNR